MQIRTSPLDRITTLSDPARYLEAQARKDERRSGNETRSMPGSDSRNPEPATTITQAASNQAQKALNTYGHLQKNLTSEDQLAYASTASVDFYA